MKIGNLVALIALIANGVVATLAQNTPPASPATVIGMDDTRIVLLGQIDTGNPKSPRLGYPETGFVVRFQGSSLALLLSCDSEKSALTVVVDHGAPVLQLLQKGAQKVVLARAARDCADRPQRSDHFPDQCRDSDVVGCC